MKYYCTMWHVRCLQNDKVWRHSDHFEQNNHVQYIHVCKCSSQKITRRDEMTLTGWGDVTRASDVTWGRGRRVFRIDRLFWARLSCVDRWRDPEIVWRWEKIPILLLPRRARQTGSEKRGNEGKLWKTETKQRKRCEDSQARRFLMLNPFQDSLPPSNPSSARVCDPCSCPRSVCVWHTKTWRNRPVHRHNKKQV